MNNSLPLKGKKKKKRLELDVTTMDNHVLKYFQQIIK